MAADVSDKMGETKQGREEDRVRELEQELRVTRADLVKARHDLDLVVNSRFWTMRNKVASMLGSRSTPAGEGTTASTGPSAGKPTILIIDTHCPQPDRESGAVRLAALMRIMQSLGYALIFVPEDGLLPEPYTSDLREMGVTVIGSMSPEPDAADAVAPLLDNVAVAWVCRPGPCRTYFPRLLRHSHIRLVYDTIDLHYIRLKRQAELAASQTQSDGVTPGLGPPTPNLSNFVNGGARTGSKPVAQERDGSASRVSADWERIKDLELTMARLADRVVVVTGDERDTLALEGISHVDVVPNVHVPVAGVVPGFGERSGLLFIGGYRHEPNVDAVLWFCSEILPIIHKTHPDIRVTLLGSDPPPSVRRLQGGRILVPGYVKDASPYFQQARVFVCPLRYGAGMKGKVGQSLSYGLPVVSTAIGAEGMGLSHGVDVLVADRVEAFAAATLKANADEGLWNQLSTGGLAKVQSFSADALTPVVDALLQSVRASV